jgi:HEAT repeat protein
MTITHDLHDPLRDPDPEVRRAAITELAGQSTRGDGDSLAWLLADPDEGVRAAAAAALRDLPEIYLGEDGVQALRLAAAQSGDEKVRETASYMLALLTSSAREQYAQGLHDGEPHLRIQAILGLIALRAVADVSEGADDPSRDVRVAVAEGLGRLGAPAEALAALDQLLADHDPVVRMAALDSAALLGLPEPLAGRAVTAIAHSSWQVRKRAVVALATGDPDVAVDPLVHALRDRIVDVRRAAVQSLERWASTHPQAVTALTEALNDPDPGVRTQARWALA